MHQMVIVQGLLLLIHTIMSGFTLYILLTFAPGLGINQILRGQGIVDNAFKITAL